MSSNVRIDILLSSSFYSFIGNWFTQFFSLKSFEGQKRPNINNWHVFEFPNFHQFSTQYSIHGNDNNINVDVLWFINDWPV